MYLDEQLESVLVVRTNHPTSEPTADGAHPPVQLLAFLAHLQITLDASYISALPVSLTPTSSTQLSAPPRNASLNRLKPRPPNLHPSIFPPQTPRPTPYTAEADRRYTQAEGTPLATLVWGEKADDDTRETFSLCWSEKDKVWVGLYRLVVGVCELQNLSSRLLHSSLVKPFSESLSSNRYSVSRSQPRFARSPLIHRRPTNPFTLCWKTWEDCPL